MTGTIYTYLSAHASQGSGDETFRVLTRGYTHWASVCIDCLEVNVQHPQYCHVQSSMKPSMKPGSYHVWILLERTGLFATIHSATWECAAGYVKISIDYILYARHLYFDQYYIFLTSIYLFFSMCRKSASCTQVSALLHVLVSLTAPQFQLQPSKLESQDALVVMKRLCR